MPALGFSLLGIPNIYAEGQEVTGFHTRKDFALLVYLAESGAAHSREGLAALLWPDLPDESARRNLRQALSSLRKLIGPAWIVGSQRIALNASLHWSTDTQQLVATLRSLGERRHKSSPIPLAQLESWEAELALYRGEFLQDFHLLNGDLFEEWMISRRGEYRLMALRGLEMLADYSLAQDAFPIGLAATQRWLHLEPWAETGHALRMRLLARSGRRAEALAQYESCRGILADELGVEPMAETVALFEQIRVGAYPLAAPSQTDSGVELAPPPEQPAPQAPTIPTNLPAPLTPRIGYASELDYIQAQLNRAGSRLLTLVGMGGAGKTHLSLEAGRQIHSSPAGSRFSDGIYFVPLETIPATEEEEVAANAIAFAIATAIGDISGTDGSRQERIQRHLADKKMLLILDNLEHLLVGVPLISQILRQAGGISVLATSREALALQGEVVVELRGLNPSEGLHGQGDETPAQNDAVQLFVYQAQRGNRHFQLSPGNRTQIERICQLVDGLPLGIEMAARWLENLTLQTLEQEISASFDFLRSNRRDIPKRHLTLRAVFDHSWSLLSPEQQQLLASLAVFQPIFPWAGATAITGASYGEVEHLLKRSLLRHAGQGTLSFHPAIHQFARQKLQQEALLWEKASQAYVGYYLDLAARSAPTLFTAAWKEGKERLFADIDNLRRAFWQGVEGNRWRELSDAFETLRFLYDQVGWFWEGRNFSRAAIQRLSGLIAQEEGDDQWRLSILLGRLQMEEGWCEGRLGNLSTSETLLQRSLSHLRQLGSRMAETPPGRAEIVYFQRVFSYVLTSTGIAQNAMGNPAMALQLLQEALTMELGQENRPLTLFGLAQVHHRLGNYPSARHYAQTGLDLARQAGDQRRISLLLLILGQIERSTGQYTAAESLLQECYASGVELGDQTTVVQALKDLGDIARLRGDFASARKLLQRARAIATRKEYAVMHAEILWAFGCLAFDTKEYAEAKAHFTACLYTPEFHQFRHNQLPVLGWALLGLGEVAEAERFFRESLAYAQKAHVRFAWLEALAGIALLLRLADHTAQSDSLLAWIENEPATAQETKDRLHQMDFSLVAAQSAQSGRDDRSASDLLSFAEKIAKDI